MVQLKLFGDVDDIQYAMSLTSYELGKIKQVAPASYEFIRFIRNAVHTHESMIKHSTNQLQKKLASLV